MGKEYSQIGGLDFDELFVSVARWESSSAGIPSPVKEARICLNESRIFSHRLPIKPEPAILSERMYIGLQVEGVSRQASRIELVYIIFLPALPQTVDVSHDRLGKGQNSKLAHLPEKPVSDALFDIFFSRANVFG